MSLLWLQAVCIVLTACIDSADGPVPTVKALLRGTGPQERERTLPSAQYRAEVPESGHASRQQLEFSGISDYASFPSPGFSSVLYGQKPAFLRAQEGKLVSHCLWLGTKRRTVCH